MRIRDSVFIIITFFLIAGCARNAKTASPGIQSTELRDTVFNEEKYLLVRGKFVENDTLFFLQDYVRNWPGMKKGEIRRGTTIYLEKDSNSYYYEPEYWLTRFGIERRLDEMGVWKMYHNKKGGKPLQKVDLLGLLADWIPLHHREGKPYVFVPCEIDYPHQTRLTDSLIMEKWLEFQFIPMRGSEKRAGNCYHFDTKDGMYNDLYIYPIDGRTKAAIWERVSSEGSKYSLMIPIESARYFDLIVCSAPLEKFVYGGLWQPDEIDLRALLDSVQAGKKVDLYNLQ